MNIWTGLLFLDGSVADASLARELAGDATPPASGNTARNDDTGAARGALASDRWFTGAGQH